MGSRALWGSAKRGKLCPTVNYFITWFGPLKTRHPLLTPKVEEIIHNFLRAKAVGLGATVFALNGVEDHVHLVVSIPPGIAVAKFVGQVKAIASTKFNKDYPEYPVFFWQEEYGAFSFDAKRLPNYIAYVERQKEHHAQGTTIPALERLDESFPKLVRETPSTYWVESDEWRQELMAFESARR